MSLDESSKSILIVDDDEVFVGVLARALEKRGYSVFCAYNLTQAETQAKSHHLDFAVIDLKIERESGLDCLSILQTIHPGIRMLILTGYSSIATAVSAIKSGAVDYACKPLDADEILSILTGSRKQETIADDPVSVERMQWEHIQRILEDNQGNISATARSLGMHRRTLQRRLQKRPVKR